MQAMLATPGDLPIGPRWAYEVEWDGLRVLADVADDRVRLVTPGGRDVTGCFPELDALTRVAPDVLLDGVLVRLAGGRPDPGAPDPGPPATFMLFDVLRLYGVPLVDRSQEERRATLERLDLRGAPAAALSPVYTDGPALRAATAQQGLPGVLAKHRDAPYRPGVCPAWVRVGNRQVGAFVVGGWTRHGGARAGSGALLLGVPDGLRALRYAGRVESVPLGPDLVRRLRELAVEGPPFAPRPPRADAAAVRWCAPGVLVEVEHGGWTPAGRLRHPVFRAVRDERAPHR